MAKGKKNNTPKRGAKRKREEEGNDYDFDPESAASTSESESISTEPESSDEESPTLKQHAEPAKKKGNDAKQQANDKVKGKGKSKETFPKVRKANKKRDKKQKSEVGNFYNFVRREIDLQENEVEVPGDGNCAFSSLSIGLFGDRQGDTQLLRH